MAIIVASNTGESVAANTKTSSVVSGQNEFVGKGVCSFSALSSATGLRVTLRCGGATLIDDQPVPFFGTSGTLKVLDNNVLNQAIQGGRYELTFRNTTAGALTIDYVLSHEPMK